MPYADVEVGSLSTTQPYEIFLQLSVPANDANYALGNFMASLTLTTLSNATIADIRRPVRRLYSSSGIRNLIADVDKAIVLPPSPSILPFARATRLVQLTVPLASSLVTGVNRMRAHVELGRKDGWKPLGHGEGREVSVYAASLSGIVRPQGLRYVL